MSVRISRIQGTSKIRQEFTGFSYKDFKLFLLSILWRIIISKQYKIQIATNEITEKLRNAILNQDPLNFNDFGCAIQAIKNDQDELVSGFIYGPISKNINNFKILEILIDGFMYSFFLNSPDLPGGPTNLFINLNGSMDIVHRLFSEDQNLVDGLKKMLKLIDLSSSK